MDFIQLDVKQLILLVGVAGLIIGFIIYFKTKSKDKTTVFGEKEYEEEPNSPNKKRDYFRLRVNIENVVLEITKIGDIVSYQKETCDIVDISAGGVGIEAKIDLPIRKKVFINVKFKINGHDCKFEGKLIRKSESLYKQKIFYGVEFANLTQGERIKLSKDITAITNNRRKVPVK